VALPLLLLLATGVHAATTNAGKAPGAVDPVPPRVPSVKDSPGYVPLVDPESMAVVLGRRTNAPLVKRPLSGGEAGMEALGRAALGALHASDVDSFLKLCVTDEEFRDILWREFPQSRPATGLEWEDGWRVLSVRLRSGINGAIQDLGGHVYEFQRWESDSVTEYRNFRLHNRLTMVVRDDEGQVRRLTWIRSVVERKGRFKIYSTRD
jgi:hypothetical protein